MIADREPAVSKSRLNEYFPPVAITVGVLVLSFFLHWKWCGTYMNLAEESWQRMVDSHLSWYPFKIRYFTTYAMLLLNRVFALPLRESFFLIQFPLLLVLGPVFYNYQRILGFTVRQAWVGVFLVLSSYPVLLAFSEPTHTWDDVWTYLLVTLALALVLRSRITAATVVFTLACFAREQSLIFYPLLAMTAFWSPSEMPRRNRLLWLLAPPVLYGVFRVIVWQEMDPARFSHIYRNFEFGLRTSDTLFSLFISFGFIWVASLMALVRLVRKNRTAAERFLYWGTLISLPANLVIALFFSLTRETRILFPPFVCLVPLAVRELWLLLADLKQRRGAFRRVTQVITFSVLIGVGIYLGRAVFPSFEYRACPNIAQLWAGIHFGLVLNLMALYLLRLVTGSRATADS